MAIKIPLSQNKHTVIDDDDLYLAEQFNWNAKQDKQTFYAKTNIKRPDTAKYTTIHLHRLIMKAKQGEQIDHINGDGLDNRKSNLRIVTPRGNSQNLHIPKTSKYPGVYWSESLKKWVAQITVKGKGIQLDSYLKEEDAYKMYFKACNYVNDDEKFKEFIIDLKFNQRAKRVKGYWFATREQKYVAHINRQYIGRFDSPVDAREAYLGALMDILIDKYS